MVKKILILNDGGDYRNWGIKACIDGLRTILESSDQDFQIETLDHAFMHKKYAFEPKIFGRKIFDDNNRIARKFFSRFHILPEIADQFDRIAEMWMGGQGGPGAQIFLKKLTDVDAVIFNAEGSTYKNNIGAIKGLFMLWFAHKHCGKKSLFMNGSVTLTAVDAVLPAVVKKVFSTIDFVGVREPFSQKNILAYYPELEGKVRVFPDSVFALPVPTGDIDTEFKDKDFFVFSRSMLPMDNVDVLVGLIHKMKQIIPHAVLIAKDSEDQVLKKIARKTDSYFIGSDYNYQDIMKILKHAQCIVSGRYHHLIFATMVGCPIIPLTTSSHKIHGLVEFFADLAHTPFDATDLASFQNAIVQEVQNIANNNLCDQYQERAHQLQNDTLSQMNTVNELWNK